MNISLIQNPVFIISIIFIILLVMLIFFIYANTRRQLANNIFILFIISAILWIFSIIVVFGTNDLRLTIYAGRAALGTSTWMVFFMYYFTYIFPVKNKNYNIPFWVIITPAIFVSLFGFTPYVLMDIQLIDNVKTNIYGIEFYPLLFYFIFYFFGALFNLLSKRKQVALGELKQVDYVLFGYSISLVLILITNLIIPLITNNIYSSQYGPLMGVFFIVYVTYSILRYSFMDIRVVIRQSAVIFTTLFVLILFLVPSVIFVAFILDYILNYLILFIIIIIFIFCGLLFIPLKNSLEKFFNTYFFSSLYNEEMVLRNLIRKIPQVLNLEELINTIIDTTKNILQIEKISLWTSDTDHQTFIPLKQIGFDCHDNDDLAKNKELMKYFTSYNNPITHQYIEKLLDTKVSTSLKSVVSAVKHKMDDHGIEIILPLIVKNNIIGMIFLGRKIDGAMYTDRDISMLKVIADQSSIALENASLYKETQQFAEKMTKEVKKATSKLRRINKQLTKLDKAKSEFISIASHQLRTPLTAIKGYTSMVLEGDYGHINKQLQPAIDRIFSSSNRMASLVENLLNVSRIESGKIVFLFKELDFKEITQNIVKDFGSIVKRKGLKLTFVCSKKIPLLNADEVKIKEVVSNLIDNAIKYTEKGSIEVKLDIITKGKKFILLSVKDTGMGIEDDDLPNVFEKFRRGKKVALIHTEGLGLGMYFSQKIVEAHKGKIWVESKGVGEGSTFFVKLPL